MRIFTKLFLSLMLVLGVSSVAMAETTSLPIANALTMETIKTLQDGDCVVFRAISNTNDDFLRFASTSVEDLTQADRLKVVIVDDSEVVKVKLQITNGTNPNKWLQGASSGNDLTFVDNETDASVFTVTNPSVNNGISGVSDIRYPGMTANGPAPTNDQHSQYASYLLRFSIDNNKINCQTGGTGVCGMRTGTGAWSFFLVYKYVEPKQITVHYKDANGNDIANSETVKVVEGTTLSPKTIGLYSCSEAAKTITSDVNEVTWTYQVSLPFELSTEVSGQLQTSDAKWYRLYLKDGLVRNVKDSEAAMPVGAATTNPYEDAYWFAFTGTIDALKVWNKAAGADAPLTSGPAGTSDDNGGQTYPSFKSTKGENETSTWMISASNEVAGKTGFFLTREGTTNETLNNRNNVGYNSVAYWTNYPTASGPGNGSTFWVEDVDVAWSTLPSPATVANNRGAVGEYNVPVDYSTAYNTTEKTVEALQTLLSQVTRVELIPGKYYRIQNYARKRSTGNTNHTDADGNGGFLEGADALDYTNWQPNTNSQLCGMDPDMSRANALWQISAASGNTYTLKHMNSGKFVGGTSNSNQLVENGSAVSFTITALNATSQHNITPTTGDTRPLHVSGATTGDGGSLTNFAGGVNSPSAWYILPATEISVTIPTEGYKAVNLPVAIGAIKSIGLKAYIVTGTNDTEATLAVINDEAIVAANTPMILQGTPGQTYNLPISYEEGLSFTTQNKLSGVALCTEITDAAFVLEPTDGEAKFAKKTEGNLAQNSAYLTGTDLSDGPLALNPTGTMVKISEASALPTKAVYYDMQGRRVENPTRGIYVKSTGEKVLIVK